MRLLVCGALALSLAACSSGGTPAPNAAAQRSAGAGGGHTPAPALPSPGASGNTPSAGLGVVPSPGAPGGGAPSGSASAAAGSSASPTPTAVVVPRDVRVEAVASPACVRPGSTLTLTISTEPKAAIGWQAVYSNGYGGADPPWGGGYGGNDKGTADDAGRFRTSYVVRPNAPFGPGHIDVVIGWKGKYGYDDPPFTVGSC